VFSRNSRRGIKIATNKKKGGCNLVAVWKEPIVERFLQMATKERKKRRKIEGEAGIVVETDFTGRKSSGGEELGKIGKS